MVSAAFPVAASDVDVDDDVVIFDVGWEVVLLDDYHY